MKPNIGDNIRKLRVEKKVTQEQVAANLSISCQAVSKWENNVTTPDIFLLPAIAEYFEVSIDDLFKANMTGYKNKATRLFAVYEQSGKDEDFEKADAEYKRLIDKNEADAEDICVYGTLNQYRSDELIKKAEKYMVQAISMGHAKAEGQLISLLVSRGRHQEAISRYEEQLENAPDNPRNWQLLAFSYGGHYGGGINPEKALEVARHGLERFPNDAGLLSMCGDICRGLKKYDEAFDYWKKSLELNPDMAQNYYAMAFSLADLGQHEEAIDMWKKIIDYCKSKGFVAETAWPEKEIVKLRMLMT